MMISPDQITRSRILALQPSAYWPLDSNAFAQDWVPHASPYSMAWTGTTRPGSGAFGSQCRAFDGSTGYATTGSSVLGSSPSSYTLMAWVNGAAQASSAILALRNSSTIPPIITIQCGSTTTSAIGLTVRNDVNSTSGIESTRTAFDSTWHHVAATVSGANGMIYVDGRPDTTSGALSTGAITLNTTTVGAGVTTTSGLFYSGRIAHAAIFPYVLSAAAIQQIYQAKNGINMPDWFTSSNSGLLLLRRRQMAAA